MSLFFVNFEKCSKVLVAFRLRPPIDTKKLGATHIYMYCIAMKRVMIKTLRMTMIMLMLRLVPKTTKTEITIVVVVIVVIEANSIQ